MASAAFRIFRTSSDEIGCHNDSACCVPVFGLHLKQTTFSLGDLRENVCNLLKRKYLFKNYRDFYQTKNIHCCKMWVLELSMLDTVLMLHPLVGCFRIGIQQLVCFVWILLSYWEAS